jgi:hypothetical protein
LEFLVTVADCRKRGKTVEALSGGGSKPGPSAHSGIFDGPGFFTLAYILFDNIIKARFTKNSQK